MKKAGYLPRFLMLGGAAAALGSQALAQPMLEEVVVTASKKDVAVTDLAAAANVIGGEDVVPGGVQSVRDMIVDVPNLSIGDQFGFARVFMRGIGMTSIDIGGEGAVAFLQDGAIIPRPAAQLMGMFDLAQLEVLRGPQGTLYGRGATAGVINMVTAKPGKEFGGYIRATAGNYSLLDFEGAVDMPLSDALSARVAGKFENRDGYGTNLFSGEEVDDGSQGQGFIRGQSDSVFIIIPQDKIASYSSVLRVIVGMFINEITKYVAGREATQQPGERCTHTPMMFLLDELPQLGYMDIIENSIVIARSSRMRFWLFAQALDQLMELYPKARTMLSNCRLKMFFNLADLHTARYVSEFLGEATDLFGQKSDVLTPQELMGPNYKNIQIVIPQGMSPIKARLRLKYEDENLNLVDLRFRDYWINSDDRKNMAGRLSG